MIIVNSRLLHQLHSLSVARTHILLFFTPRIHVYGGRLFGKELHPVCYYYIYSLSLVVKDSIFSYCITDIAIAADFIFFYSCDQLK